MIIFSKTYKAILDCLFPTPTIIKELEKMTAEEIEKFLPTNPVSPFPFISSFFDFRNKNVKEVIYHIKYKGNTFLIDIFGKIILKKIYQEKNKKKYKDEVIHIVPIPLSKKRRSERGFNQTELLARSVIKYDRQKNIIYNPKFLKRIKHTKPQTKLNKSERIKNIKNCYSVPERQREKISGKTIILIDDVTTTGSTLREARLTLLKAGAKEVFAITLAH